MKVDKVFAEAISKAAEEYGSNTALGKLCGVHGATLGQYKTGVIKEMSDDTLDKLWMYVEAYLPKDCVQYWPRHKLASITIPETKPDQWYAASPNEQHVLSVFRRTNDTERQLLEGIVNVFESHLRLRLPAKASRKASRKLRQAPLHV